MIAEYVAVAGAPTADTPWPLVLMMAEHAPQFEARRQLTAFDAVRSAIGVALGGDASGDVMRERANLVERAYPGANDIDPFPPNAFAEDSGG